MKFSKLMLATIAVCGASQAMATGVTRLTGASASLVNVVKGAQALCTTSGGAFNVYITAGNGSALGNFVSTTCSADFAGTSVNELRVNVNGGSESAVTSATDGFSSAAGAAPVATAFVLPTAAACSALTASVASTTSSASVAAGQGFGALSFLPAGTVHNCGAVTAAASANTEFATSEGGSMDVDGKFFPTAAALENAGLVDPGSYVSAGFSQVFGVGVNKNLYEALQAAQYGAACAAGATTVACQPSVSRADISALINSDISSTGPKSQGANIFGLTGAVKVTYCMRPQTSGTQQGAQLYFLDYDGVGKQSIVANNAIVGTKFLATENASSGNVKTCLNTTSATDYRFGILSAENNPIGGSDTYRFVKLNDVSFTEGVAGASQTATAITGKYDYVFDSVSFCNVGGSAGTCADIITALDGSVPAGASSAGLILKSETKYGHNGANATPFRRVKP
jgi:hypothetical protein